MTVPYTFGTSTSPIPLSNLDANFSAVSNSTNINYVPPFTGGVSETVQNKLAQIVSVKDFGAVGDGVTDDTAAIQAAITYVASINGGTVNIPAGTFKVTGTFTIANSNIIIQGAGGGTPHDAGTGASAATTLNYAGVSATSLYMFNFITPPNVGASVRTGGGLLNIGISCNALLAGGLKIISWRDANFTDLVVFNSIVSAYYVSCWKTGVEVPEAADTQRCEFNRCTYRSIDSSAVYNAKGFILTSESWPTSDANTSFNSFTYCSGQSYNGTSWYIVDTDNNDFISCGGGTVGAGKGFEIWGDSNYFYDLTAGGSPSVIYIYGTVSGNILNPVSNCFMFPDQGNGTNYPHLDANCTCYWQGSYGVLVKGRSAYQVISDNQNNANILSLSSALSVYSLIVDSGSVAGMAFTKSGLTTGLWGVNFGSGASGNDLRINTTTNGTLNLGNLCPVSIPGPTVTFDGVGTTASAPNAYLNNASSNLLLRSTSSAKYKTNVETLLPEYSDNIFNLRPVWYQSLAKDDKKEWSWYGLIAEEVALVEPRLVHYSYDNDCYDVTETIDESGTLEIIKTLKPESKLTPDGVQYERIIVLMLDVIQRQEKRILEIEKKLENK